MSNCLIEKLNGAVDGSGFPTFDKYAGLVTSYTINQNHLTEDPITYRLPSDMVEKYEASKDAKGTIKIEGTVVKTDVIARIRDLSELYVGQLHNSTFEVKKISKTDKTEYADGTTIVYDNSKDGYMKLPRFWWRCASVSTDTYKVDFTLDSTIPATLGGNWNEWDGNTFIGIYKATYAGLTSQASSVVLFSKPCDVRNSSEYNLFWGDVTTFSHNKGTGFSIIKYDTFKMMFLLGLGWFKTTRFDSVCGEGMSNNAFAPLGLCDYLGMEDTTTDNEFTYTDGSDQITVHAVNFWGLENWWGDLSEWIEDLKSGTSGAINIVDSSDNVLRTVTTNVLTTPKYASKLILGQYGDIIPTEVNDGENGFGMASVSSTSGYVFRTQGEEHETNTLLCAYNPSVGQGCARLQWYGNNWQEVNNFSV